MSRFIYGSVGKQRVSIKIRSEFSGQEFIGQLYYVYQDGASRLATVIPRGRIFQTLHGRFRLLPRIESDQTGRHVTVGVKQIVRRRH